MTHGFQSQFTEPLLTDLLEAVRSLEFKSPSIHLESCTNEEIRDINPEHIVQHTREPVFFYQAVRRLEQRFGSCLWLEAGFDSPITSMTKRAVAAPEKHHFQDIRVSTGPDPCAVLSSVTAKIWEEGVPSSYWGFHQAPEANNFGQVWLPPYQFERNQHWMPYTDHALEINESMPVGGKAESTVETTYKPPRLVEHRMKPTEKGEYTMNTGARRYVDIVSGHAVVGKPLCPAAMYMERAVMAAQLSLGTIESQSL